ncbi:MAG: RNA polymerase sporulation sigma factor SigK [Clostridia bacterium]|nr:RNA polymerase sporulation sigma factor SigK [Clostridia bacterium]
MFWDKLLFLLGKIIFFTSSIGGGNSFPKPLSPEKEAECLKRMREGDEEAREILISHNLRLVAHIVKKYQGADSADDLISAGSIGLIKAINTFEPSKGTQLATYTARCIENEILMLLRSNKKHRNVVSLSDTFGTDKDGNELTFMDLISVGEDSVFKQVDKNVQRAGFMRALQKNLSEREYKIICLRYGLNGNPALPQREVAALLRISRSYISRIEKKAIEKLRKVISDKEFFVD